jgi:hypothetical protein
MTRQEFFDRLKFIRLKGAPRVDKKARQMVRLASLSAVKRAQAALLSGAGDENIKQAVNREKLTQEWIDAVNFAKEETAQMTSEANADFIVSQMKQASFNMTENAAEEIEDYLTAQVLKTIDKIDKFEGAAKNAAAKGYGAAYKAKGWDTSKGVGFYTTDIETGVKHFLDKQYYLKFSKEFDLSASVWADAQNMESQILNTVWAARAQGIDPVKTAKSLENLLFGKEKVIGSWGKLKPQAAEYVKRIGSAGVDYRALRIVRTENARAMNEAIKEADKLNPATTGEFDWILVPSREEWNCECEHYAQGGPYKAEELPEIPAHPNCVCQIRPRLKDWDKFKRELIEKDDDELPNLKQLSDYGSVSEAKGTIKTITNWTGVEELSDKQFKYLYSSVKDTTSSMRELLGVKGMQIKLSEYVSDIVKMSTGRSLNATYAEFSPFTKNIHFGSIPVNKWKAEYKEGVKSGYFPKGTDANAVLIHEFGHALTKTQNVKLNNIVNDVFNKFKNEFKDIEDMKKNVSRLAEKNNREFFAEAFSDYIQNGKKANKISIALIEAWKKL